MRYLHVFLFIGSSCDPGPLEPRVAEVVPQELLSDVDAGLEDALMLWSNERYSEAQSAVEGTYLEAFEPMETLLRHHDWDQCVRLEYSFGRLSWNMRRPGDPEDISQEVAALRSSLSEAVNALQPSP